MARKKKVLNFEDNTYINNRTYNDYLDRFKKIALSIFEWVNLPSSMNSEYLERCLFYEGQAALLKDKNFGFINTRCCSNGKINIYGFPTSLNCYSYEYSEPRKLYTGLKPDILENEKEDLDYEECILVRNNWERIPTARYFRTICNASI